MNIAGLIAGILQPAKEIIDELHTSPEEKLILRNQLREIDNKVTEKILGYEQRLLAARTSIITAEATGQSWMQRNWRPVTMLTFLILVVFDSFGLLKFRLASEAWTLLQLGLGGYVVGRSIEKIIPNIKKK